MWAWVRKWFLNHFVIVGLGLPQLALNLGTQFIVNEFVFHWIAYTPLLAYLIGTGVSIEYSNLLGMKTRSRFNIKGWKWSYAPDEKK